MLDVLAEEQVTTFCAPPTVWRMLVQQDLSQWQLPLRELVGAGERLVTSMFADVRGYTAMAAATGVVRAL